MNFVESLNMFGVEAKEIPCIVGSGAPTATTAGAVGLLYMNADNGDVYKCTDADDVGYTWMPFENGKLDASVEEFANLLLSNSIKQYGAKGDGTTDDTEAFQTALAKKRVVTVPSGTYLLSDTLVIRENCCLEMSQDTILKFTKTTGNCIEMRGSATLRGNHGNIDVSSNFTGNVISVDTGLDGVVHASIPPYQKSTPMWKRQRFIHDVNITRTEGGFQGSLTGNHSGTALYVSANYETTEEYDGTNTAPITYIWAMSVSGLRIGGAFDYGINIQNKDTTTSGYGNSGDPAWNHDMRIEAVIVGCETGVRVFNCNTAHLDVTVQPALSINKVGGSYVRYAKNGIILEHSNHIDLSQSIVWDWNSTNTLIDTNEKNAHIAMIGECKGVILSDFLYNASETDIRDLIYTDTPSNFDTLIILQEPITRWFKPKNNEPYFYDGNGDKRLALKEEVDEFFQTDRVPIFTNVLKTAIDTDGSIYNGTGTASGYYNSNFTTLTGGSSGAYHIHTGFIACTKGDTFITDGIKLRDDGCVRIACFDSDFNYIFHVNGGNMISGNYQLSSTITENGFRITINPHDDANINKVAFARFNFNILDLGNDPVMSINDEIKFTQEGFLADGIKVKAENVVGKIIGGDNITTEGYGGATPDWNASEGEAGHILNRTHWSKYEYVTLIDNVVLDDEVIYPIVLVAGQEYTVVHNGVEYNMEAFSVNLAGLDVVGLGNLMLFGLSDEDETPFSFMYMEAMGGTTGYNVYGSESSTVTVSGYQETVQKIPKKYIPDLGTFFVECVANGMPPTSVTPMVSPSAVYAAFASGRDIALRYGISQDNISFMFVCRLVGSMSIDGLRSYTFATNGISDRIEIKLLPAEDGSDTFMDADIVTT